MSGSRGREAYLGRLDSWDELRRRVERRTSLVEVWIRLKTGLDNEAEDLVDDRICRKMKGGNWFCERRGDVEGCFQLAGQITIARGFHSHTKSLRFRGSMCDSMKHSTKGRKLGTLPRDVTFRRRCYLSIHDCGKPD